MFRFNIEEQKALKEIINDENKEPPEPAPTPLPPPQTNPSPPPTSPVNSDDELTPDEAQFSPFETDIEDDDEPIANAEFTGAFFCDEVLCRTDIISSTEPFLDLNLDIDLSDTESKVTPLENRSEKEEKREIKILTSNQFFFPDTLPFHDDQPVSDKAKKTVLKSKMADTAARNKMKAVQTALKYESVNMNNNILPLPPNQSIPKTHHPDQNSFVPSRIIHNRNSTPPRQYDTSLVKKIDKKLMSVKKLDKVIPNVDDPPTTSSFPRPFESSNQNKAGKSS